MSFEAQRQASLVRDRFNRALAEGDELFVAVPDPIPFRVVGLRPALDPKLPNNTVHLDLAATITFTCPSGSALRQVTRTRTVEEAGPAPFARLPGSEGIQ